MSTFDGSDLSLESWRFFLSMMFLINLAVVFTLLLSAVTRSHWRENIYYGSLFHSREAIETGIPGSWPHCIHCQKAEEDRSACFLLFVVKKMVLLTSEVCLPQLAFPKLLLVCYRCVSTVIINSVRFTMKINHHKPFYTSSSSFPPRNLNTSQHGFTLAG